MNAIEKITVSYDSDVYAWALEQARLIRERRFDRLDIENVAEEIETVGRSERRAVQSLFENLLIHLACLNYSPASDPRRHCQGEVRNFRKRLERELKGSPSLRPALSEDFAEVWGLASWEALKKMEEDGVRELPNACPFTLAQVLDPDFFPEPGH